MPTRKLVLSAHQQPLINTQGKSARQPDTREVPGEGLRLLGQGVAEEVARIAALRQAASAGIADLQQACCSEVQEDQLQQYLEDLELEAAAQEKHWAGPRADAPAGRITPFTPRAGESGP